MEKKSELEELIDMLRARGVTRYETPELKLELAPKVEALPRSTEASREAVKLKRRERSKKVMFAHVEGYHAD